MLTSHRQSTRHRGPRQSARTAHRRDHRLGRTRQSSRNRCTVPLCLVVDCYGLKTLDVTDLARPELVEKGKVALGDPRNVYVARTYAYVADGRFGLSIVDVENPEQPRRIQEYSASGVINDTNDV